MEFDKEMQEGINERERCDYINHWGMGRDKTIPLLVSFFQTVPYLVMSNGAHIKKPKNEGTARWTNYCACPTPLEIKRMGKAFLVLVDTISHRRRKKEEGRSQRRALAFAYPLVRYRSSHYACTPNNGIFSKGSFVQTKLISAFK